MAKRFDRIWLNARLATVREDMPGLGVIEDGLIASRGGRIAFAGSRSDFPPGADDSGDKRPGGQCRNSRAGTEPITHATS